jgi:hypothetical protein
MDDFLKNIECLYIVYFGFILAIIFILTALNYGIKRAIKAIVGLCLVYAMFMHFLFPGKSLGSYMKVLYHSTGAWAYCMLDEIEKDTTNKSKVFLMLTMLKPPIKIVFGLGPNPCHENLCADSEINNVGTEKEQDLKDLIGKVVDCTANNPPYSTNDAFSMYIKSYIKDGEAEVELQNNKSLWFAFIDLKDIPASGGGSTIWQSEFSDGKPKDFFIAPKEKRTLHLKFNLINLYNQTTCESELWSRISHKEGNDCILRTDQNACIYDVQIYNAMNAILTPLGGFDHNTLSALTIASMITAISTDPATASELSTLFNNIVADICKEQNLNNTGALTLDQIKTLSGLSAINQTFKLFKILTGNSVEIPTITKAIGLNLSIVPRIYIAASPSLKIVIRNNLDKIGIVMTNSTAKILISQANAILLVANILQVLQIIYDDLTTPTYGCMDFKLFFCCKK